MRISRELSSYINFLRFTAAIAVMLGHLDQDGIPMNWLPLAKFSHEAVIVFFVLSGFIIYNNTESKSVTARDYSLARLSRIYSVAIPAIIFSFLVSWAVQQWGQKPYPTGYEPLSFADFFGSVFFTNSSWNSQTRLTLNNPYWSLCYEVWFYVMFGIFAYLRGQARWLLLCFVAFFVGPAILTLFPLWIIGAWAASHMKNEARWDGWRMWMAFLFAPALILAINLSGIDVSAREWLKNLIPGFWRLEQSQRFISDYAIGIALIVHLLAFSSLPRGFHKLFIQWEKIFATLAGFSFTLYLFHRPVTQVIGRYFPDHFQSTLGSACIAMLVFFACWAISFISEQQLPAWKNAFDSLFGAFETRLLGRFKNPS